MIAIEFLKQLRPSGSWVLTAIDPNSPKITTITADDEAQAAKFIAANNGKRNLYYSVNPTRTAMSRKAAKKDIAAVEYLLADLDPADNETPEQAKARYLDQLNNGFKPQPTAVVDSGNGIQCLWRLTQPLALGAPVGKEYSPEDQATITDVEARVAAVMVRLGAKAGTQNIDRILRLPGTTNLPNAKKQKQGRVACPTAMLHFNGVTYKLEEFALPTAEEANRQEPPDEPNRPGTPDDGGQHARQEHDDRDELDWTIRERDIDVGKRSDRVWWVIMEMFRRGYRAEAIVSTLLDTKNKISLHIYDQANPPRYAKRQVERARKETNLAADTDGKPYKIPANIRIAFLKLGITLRYDRFADRTLIEGLPDFGPVLDDAAVNRIWLLMDQRFRFRPAKDVLYTVVTDTAQLNGFHPVRDYLDSLKWDGTKRIDTWLTTYGEAEDTEYARAVGALMLIAAVRRVRRPGCKFDEMPVFENPVQGTLKSTALATIAVKEEWYSDDLPLNLEGKRVIESLRGRWIIEAAELSGMRRVDIEHLKAFLSRQVDRARLAYGHIVSEVPRQSLIIGTTNSIEYLRDQTGNRRFWPVRCKQFNIAALQRDRDQLWAEAAAREASGASIRMDQKLWPMAAEEQARRRTADPYYDALHQELNDKQGKISSASVWEILDVKAGARTQDQSRRMADAMRALGWERPNEASLVKIAGKSVVGWFKGEKPWREITADRLDHGRLYVAVKPEQPEEPEQDELGV